jgi:hypothetical protein
VVPRQVPLLLLSVALAIAGAVRAVTVYRCVDNGSVAYRQSASDPNCEAMDLQSDEPDAEFLSRQRQALEQSRERRLQASHVGRRKRTTTRGQNEAGMAKDDRNEDQHSTYPFPPLPRELEFNETPP